MSNSKKVNGKSSRRVYSRSDKAITLIALIVTIIVLLILAGVTINLAVNNQGIFNKAKTATGAYKMAGAREKIETLMSEYVMEKVTNESLTLKDYLAEKEGIGNITDNGDGTLSVEVDDVYLFKIKDDGTEVIDTETLKGIVPNVSYELYSDTAGTSKIDKTKKYDKIYIGVKVSNASDYTSTPTIELKDTSGKTLSSTSVNGFNGYYEVNKEGSFTLKVTGTNKDGTRSKTQTITIANLAILPGSTILRKNAPKISVLGLKYADIDGDGIADGIIVADISEASKDYPGGNPWGNSNGSFSYTKKETSELREYSENTYEYTNADGYKVEGTLIKCKNNTGTPRYYVLSLADYDANGHYWYKNAYGKMSDSTSTSKFTSEDFGKGKENTEKMIERMKNHSDIKYNGVDYGEPTTGTNADIWNIIEDKVKEGWFVPSKAEWAAFASYLNTSKTSAKTNYYVNYGLNNWYWSSSQFDGNSAWYVKFGNGYMFILNVDNSGSLRLCTTF